MTVYSRNYRGRSTPQRQKADVRQGRNNAGGYTFKVDPFEGLNRFLVLGAEGGSYYASERKLVQGNCATLEACLRTDGVRAVNQIVEVSKAGRAPKNTPAIFALAVATSPKWDLPTRKAALAAIPEVARTGSHLLEFVNTIVEGDIRGWGRGLKSGVMGWYLSKDPDSLAYQAVKYQNRNGFSHRDVLRLAHGGRDEWDLTKGHEAVFRWIVAGMDMGRRSVSRNDGPDKTYGAIRSRDIPEIIQGWEAMKRATSAQEAVKLIQKYGLTHEMVKNEFKSSPAVWEALLERMPVTATIRNLGRMTANGTLAPMSNSTQAVVGRLTDSATLRRGRVHPMSVLVAANTYNLGRGIRGNLTWSPIPQISAALEDAYDLAFGAVEPSNKRELLAIDVSGSMGFTGDIVGMPGITARVAAAAMAHVTVRTEPTYHTLAFSHTLHDLALHKRMSLRDVVSATSRLPFGGTDCALPMLWALKNNVPVDTFRVYTDNETWYGDEHPHEALRRYRDKMGIPARLIVVGMVANDFTIADPSDPGMLDVVGFDTAAPNLMNSFSRGEF